MTRGRPGAPERPNAIARRRRGGSEVVQAASPAVARGLRGTPTQFPCPARGPPERPRAIPRHRPLAPRARRRIPATLLPGPRCGLHAGAVHAEPSRQDASWASCQPRPALRRAGTDAPTCSGGLPTPVVRGTKADGRRGRSSPDRGAAKIGVPGMGTSLGVQVPRKVGLRRSKWKARAAR